MTEEKIIIDGRQKKRFKWIEFLVTFVGWGYLIGFLISIILTVTLWIFNISRFYSLFNVKSMTATLYVVLITLGIATLGFIIIFAWKRYNLKRFGRLRRRKFPAPYDAIATAEFFSLSVERVEEYQSSRLIILEKTIV